MALAAFFLGLALGLGFWLMQQLWRSQQLQRLLAMLPEDDVGSSFPQMARLRRGIARVNQQMLQLETQLQTWEQILQVAPAGYLQVDEENQLLWCNEQARQLLSIHNWEPEQSRLLLKVVRSYELDQLIEQTRQRQQPSECEWVFHPAIADGEALRRGALTLRGYSWPLRAGQVGVFLENRQDFVALSQARNRWVSDLAHELRTPLTSIRLVAETLQGRLQPPLSTWVERMLVETNRLIKLVQDWLDLIQMEADPSKNLKRKPLELQALIQSVWQSLEPLAKQKQLSLAYSEPEKLLVEADESGLYRVFLNLFDNSIRYSPHQGTIQVSASLSPANVAPTEAAGREQVQIDIIDSGPGFPEADLPYVFDRLYRGDPSRARGVWATNGLSPQPASGNSQILSSSSTGSGLGLAIVLQIVLAHGGTVTARNHPQTGGAWLQIHLFPPGTRIASHSA
ncbi:MAG: histidine kinase [Oscillatoria princeps RMCB-10]|jgi:two-component system phosphate regulon sensor histidine kinase PhoR|nr:histidine kinase [Oscillatoria princeps RMCB-10]